MADEQQVDRYSAIGKFIAQVGLPAALLIAVGYFFLWPAWDKQVEATPRIEQKIDQHVTRTEAIAEEQHKHGVAMERLILAQCLNAAQTQEERDRCLGLR